MGRFNEFKNEIIEMSNTNKELTKNTENLMPHDKEIHLVNSKNLEDGLKILMNKYLHKNGIDHVIESVFNFVDAEYMESLRNTEINELVAQIKTFNKDFTLDKNLSYLEKRQIIVENLKDHQDLYKKGMDFAIGQITSMTIQHIIDIKDPNSIQEYLNKMEEVAPNIIDDIAPTKEEYSVKIYDKNSYIHVMEDEINTIIEANKDDKEYVEALKDANEILLMNERMENEFIGGIAEKTGESLDTIMRDSAVDQIKNDPRFNIDDFEIRRRYLTPSENLSISGQASIIEKASNKHEINEENKNKLINIMNKMKENNIFDIKDFKSESGTKFYSMTKLIEKRTNLRSAILNSDKESIIQAVKEYRDLEKVYDSIIKDLKDISKDERFVSNVSSSRTQVIDPKYKLDYVGVSKLTGVWMYMGFLDQQKLDPKMLMNDPINNLKSVVKNFIKESETVKLSKSLGLSDCINELSKGDNSKFYNAYQKDAISVDGLDRSLYGMLYALGADDKLLKDMSITFGFYATKCLNNIISSDTYTYFDVSVEDSIEKIERMILVEKEDLDIFKLNPNAKNNIDPETEKPYKEFNKEEYLREKTTPLKVMDRMINTLNDYKTGTYSNTRMAGTVEVSCSNLARTIPSNNLSKSGKKVLDAIKNQSLENVLESDLKNVKAEIEFEKDCENKLSPDDAVKALKNIAEIKKSYNSRNFLAKIFFPSVRRQSDAIDNLVDKFSKETGMDKILINRCLDSIVDEKPDVQDYFDNVKLIISSTLESKKKYEEMHSEEAFVETEKEKEDVVPFEIENQEKDNDLSINK